MISADTLGDAEFRQEYGVRYAYLAGSMFKGISSVELVVRMSQAGLMGFFGAGGLSLDQVDESIQAIREGVGPEGRFGMNLLATPDDPAGERETVALYLRNDVRFVEASAYTQVTPGLVHFRFKTPIRHVMAKVSRPEVASAFMSPPAPAMVDDLVAEGALTEQEAQAALELPVATDVCVEADSGGHTDAGNPYALMSSMTRLRDELMARRNFPSRIRIGAAGGLGSPESVAAAFVLGADFVVTGSVNQCTPEAGTSDEVKDMLAGMDVQDTAYAPAGDMFEMGARVQVARKGTLFPARANKLYQLYRTHDGLDSLDGKTLEQIEGKYFRRSIDAVWEETKEYLAKNRSHEITRAEQNPKVKMALVFRWYFVHSTRMAMRGITDERVNFQIHSGPAIGAFNRVVAGTPMQSWRNRHCDAIAELLMTGAAEHLRRMT